MLWNILPAARHGIRAVTARPVFSAVVVLTLALGIGLNVAAFSLFQQILLRPLPVPEPDRLVSLTDPGPKTARMDPQAFPQTRPSGSGGADTLFSYPMFRDLERAQTPFAGLAAHTLFDASVSTGGQPRLGTGVIVSGSYFPVLGLHPALGRLLGAEDDRVDGQAESVVLSHAYWQSEFGGDPGVLGRTLTVNDVRLNIVGVAPREFHGTAVGARPSFFVPITITFPHDFAGPMAASLFPSHTRRDSYWVHLFARLAPGVTSEAAAAAVNPLYRAILSDVEAPRLTGVNEQQREAFLTRTLTLEPGERGQTSSQILAPARTSLELLLAVSGGVLLLCCANVAGLMLLRATARTGEIAVRAALGATRARLGALLLGESLVLALPAAALGLPVAWWALRGASRVPGIPAAALDVTLSAPAALVAIGVAVVSAVVVALFPIRGLTRSQPVKALRAYGARQTNAKGAVRFRAALATAQIALSMALLAMTGVFAQSLANIARLDLGADIDSVVMFDVSRPELYTNMSVFHGIEEAVGAIPGVTSVASSGTPVLSLEAGFLVPFTLEGAEAQASETSMQTVSFNFFRTFGIELLAGRELNDTDDVFTKVVVNQRFAEHFGLFPEQIVGRSIKAGGITAEVVGVVADVRSRKVTEEILPQAFTRYSDNSFTPRSTLYVRSARPPDDLMNAIRETVARAAPTMPITNLQTMQQQLRKNVATERFVAGASTAFAVVATALAALGLFGILAYSVAQRAREIGLRVALGAPSGRIRTMVLRQVAAMAVVGIALGAVASSVLGRAAQSVLFGVEAGDGFALAAAAALLVAVAFAAAYIPIRRALRVDPMTVLRYE